MQAVVRGEVVEEDGRGRDQGGEDEAILCSDMRKYVRVGRKIM
jgi:hypothetical protein